MSGSFNTKNGILFDGELTHDGGAGPNVTTDPVFAQNMFYINSSIEVFVSAGMTFTGDIYLEASNDRGNETPGIGTTSVSNWVVLDSAAISVTDPPAHIQTLSNTDFAYRWFRFRYELGEGATSGIEGKIRYTMKGW